MIRFGKSPEGSAPRHPHGLGALFFTEMWERFSFYGLQALLILYLVLPVDQGGMGYTVPHAAAIYGNYTMGVYLLSMLGGWVADKFIGAAMAVVCGACVIITGHCLLAFGSSTSLFTGLSCVALGTSFLKPNVTTLVGRLYTRGDARRDAGFSLYYMGINIGAVIAPLVCGYLAQGEGFRETLAAAGLDPRKSWHFGFAAAGVGMLIGLGVFAKSWRMFHDLSKQRPEEDVQVQHPSQGSSAGWIVAIAFFCLTAVLFFTASKQAGSSLNLFADRMTRSEAFGWAFPSSWFQSVNALFVIILAPLFSMLWLRLGPREPSGPTKAVIGLAAASLSFLIMTFAAQAAGSGPVSPLWLLAAYFAQSAGEMCVSPVGLSNVTRLAPLRHVGLAMGVWFVAIGLGAKLAGMAAGWMGAGEPDELSSAFGQQALFMAVACAVMALLAPRVRARISRHMETSHA